MGNGKRAVLYARVSSDDRANESRNLNGQLGMCREHARARNYEIVAELAEDDRGASGAAFELPQLNRVRELAEARAFDVLVVRELDRLSRNLAKQLFVEAELRRGHVQIEYVLGEYPNTPEGNLMKHIRASVAEFERLKIAERTHRGRRQKAAAGHVLTHGNTPLGYELVEQDGRATLQIVEEEARVVRRIFDLYAAGGSVRAVALQLTGEGVPTPGTRRGRRIQPRQTGRWASSSLYSILRNETYVGTWHYGKRGVDEDGHAFWHDVDEWFAVSVPPIVSQELWKQVQERLRVSADRSERSLKYEYLLRRRLWCGLCETKVVGHPLKGSASYYRCGATGTSSVAHAQECSAPSFSVRWVDEAVWNWVRGLLMNEDQLTAGFEQVRQRNTASTAPLAAELAEIIRTRSELDGQLGRLIDLYVMGTLPKALLEERSAIIQRKLAAISERARTLEQQIAGATISDAEIADMRAFVAVLAKGLPDAERDFAWRRWVIERLDVRGRLVVVKGVKMVEVYCPIANARTLRLRDRPGRTVSPASEEAGSGQPPALPERSHLVSNNTSSFVSWTSRLSRSRPSSKTSTSTRWPRYTGTGKCSHWNGSGCHVSSRRSTRRSRESRRAIWVSATKNCGRASRRSRSNATGASRGKRMAPRWWRNPSAAQRA